MERSKAAVMHIDHKRAMLSHFHGLHGAFWSVLRCEDSISLHQEHRITMSDVRDLGIVSVQ